MAYESNELEGSLFAKNEAEIIGKGKIPIGGKDRYMALVRSKMPNGDDIVELMVSVGRIYQNEKTNEKQPDLGGNITYDAVKYRFAGWQNVSQNGSDYVKAKLTINEQDAPF